jgi:O-antigen/teichoic acid export membrane protein
MMLNGLLSAFLKSVKSFKSINRVTLTNSILNMLTYSGLYYLNLIGVVDVDIKVIFLVSFLIVILNSILWLISFFKYVSIEIDFNLSLKTDLVPFFKYIFPVYISIIINSLNYRLDLWLISFFEGSNSYGNAQVGLYSLAVNFSLFILLYSRLISSVLMPYLSENDDVQRRKYFAIYSRIIFTTVSVFIVLLILFGESLIVFVYGDAFSDSARPFKILLAGMLFTSMSQLFNTMLFSKGSNKIAIVANSGGLIVTLVLDVLLIPRYGSVGAAVATSFSYFFIFIIYLYYLLAKERIRMAELFLVKKTDFVQLLKRD